MSSSAEDEDTQENPDFTMLDDDLSSLTELPEDDDGEVVQSESERVGNEEKEEEEDEDEEAEHGESDEEEEDIDVKDILYLYLSDDLDHAATFAFRETYPGAPNPVLRIVGLDIVGLPLNIREAESIRAFSVKIAPAQNDVSHGVWNLDASQVHCEEPEWSSFVERLVKDAGQHLGFTYSSETHHVELRALQLFGPGSRIKPLSSDSGFATLMVILPSPSVGPAVHFSYAGLSVTVDSQLSNVFRVTALSWLNAASVSTGPMTQGYRLALTYSIRRLESGDNPSTTTLGTAYAVQKIRQALQFWTRDQGMCAPDKILYLLDDSYPADDLSFESLRGPDAHKGLVLQNIAQSLGLHVGLANIDCYLSGFADKKYKKLEKRHQAAWQERRASKQARREDYYEREERDWQARRPPTPVSSSSEESEEEQDVDFGHVDDREAVVDKFVDFQGRLLSDALEFDENETIPQDLSESVEIEVYYQQEYSGFRDDGDGELERWYNRTVLVIWPPWSDLQVRYGKHDLKGACEHIDAIISASPSAEEMRVVEHVLSKSAADPRLVADTVCHIALIWKDQELWLRTVDTCTTGTSGGVILSLNNIRSAITTLSFEVVQPRLEKMLESEQTNSERYRFLDELDVWATSLKSRELSKPIRVWIASSRQDALDNDRRTKETARKSSGAHSRRKMPDSVPVASGSRVVSVGTTRLASSSLPNPPPAKRKKKDYDPADIIDLSGD